MEIELRKAIESDISFAFDVKKQALGPHVKARWEWDEEFQSQLRAQRWIEKEWYILEQRSEKIGTCTIDYQPGVVCFGEFYLVVTAQGKGIGTHLLQQLLAKWDEQGYRIKLEYLKWNPAGSLYKRHGFHVVGESDSHYYMVREPNAH